MSNNETTPAWRIVRDAAKEHPWRMESDERLAFLRSTCAKLDEQYGLEPIAVEYTTESNLLVEENGEEGAFAALVFDAYGIPGAWIAAERTILLNPDRFSLLTLLHFHRRAQQADAGREDDPIEAQTWAIDLFRAACPRRFRRMKAAGRIHDPREVGERIASQAPVVMDFTELGLGEASAN